jgi:hypothetical protein
MENPAHFRVEIYTFLHFGTPFLRAATRLTQINTADG